MKEILFRHTCTYVNENTKVRVMKYEPQRDIYVKAFNMETGKIQTGKVTLFSVHKGVQLYKISLPEYASSIKDFWGTEDHGYVVFDTVDQKYLKVGLFDIDKNRHMFVRLLDGGTIQHLNLQSLCIEKVDKSKLDTAFDFTVDGLWTFSFSDGLVVYDTMAIYSSLLPQTTKELSETIMDPQLQIHPGKFTYLIDEIVLGISHSTRYAAQQNEVQNSFTTMDEFMEACIRQGYAYLIENYARTVNVGKKINTVSRFFYSNIFEFPVERIGSMITRDVAQRCLTRVWYKYVMLPKLEGVDEHTRLHKYKLFWQKINHICRSSSKLMNGLPVNLELIYTSEVAEIVNEYKKKLSQLDPKEDKQLMQQLIKSTVQEISKVNARFGNGSKLANVVDQMILSRGYIGLEFIANSYLSGLTNVDMFKSAVGNRRGMINKTINVSDGGYLLRKLIFSTHNIRCHENINDASDFCGTTNLIRLENYNVSRLHKDFLFRNIVLDGKEVFLDFETIDKLQQSNQQELTFQVYSPMYCLDEKFCLKCIPKQYRYFSTLVGPFAAQSVAEDIQQSLMRDFHTGGKVDNQLSMLIDPDYLYTESGVLFSRHNLILDDVSKVSVGIEIRYTTPNEEAKTDVIYNVSDFSLLVEKLPCAVSPGTPLVKYNQLQKIYEILVKKVDFGLRDKSSYTTPESLFDLLKFVECQSIHKEIVCSAVFYDMDKKTFARLTGYTNYTKIGITTIPYMNKLVGLCFERLGRISSFEDVTKDNSFFNAILTSNTNLVYDARLKSQKTEAELH